MVNPDANSRWRTKSQTIPVKLTEWYDFDVVLVDGTWGCEFDPMVRALSQSARFEIAGDVRLDSGS